MNDVDVLDSELELRLRNHVLGLAVARPPEAVVARVLAAPSPRLWWPIRLSLAPIAVALLVVAIGGAAAIASLINSSGSQPGRATVNGVQYELAAARSLAIPAELLDSYSVASSVQMDTTWLDSLTVFSVQGIDPGMVLVLKLRPGVSDDAGSLGSYFLLVRGPDAFLILCEYFDPTSPATPRDCREPNP